MKSNLYTYYLSPSVLRGCQLVRVIGYAACILSLISLSLACLDRLFETAPSETPTIAFGVTLFFVGFLALIYGEMHVCARAALYVANTVHENISEKKRRDVYEHHAPPDDVVERRSTH